MSAWGHHLIIGLDFRSATYIDTCIGNGVYILHLHFAWSLGIRKWACWASCIGVGLLKRSGPLEANDRGEVCVCIDDTMYIWDKQGKKTNYADYIQPKLDELSIKKKIKTNALQSVSGVMSSWVLYPSSSKRVPPRRQLPSKLHNYA